MSLPQLPLSMSCAARRAYYMACNLAVNEYTSAEAAQLATPLRFCFATIPSSRRHLITPSIARLYEPATFETLLCPKSPAYLHALPSLHCDNALSSFTIYPTTDASLRVNHLLWNVVRSGTYDPTEGDPLLGAHVFVLGLAPELYNLLSTFSLSHIHRGIIDFLVLLHHQLTVDADHNGLAKLSEDLLPHIWLEVNANIGIFPNGEPTDCHRAKVLEQLVQVSFMTPWRVDVFAAYLTPNNVTELIHYTPSSNPIACTPSQPCLALCKQNTAASLQGKVMLKLYQDWRVFCAVLHDGMGLPYEEVTEAMERAVFAGKSPGLFEQAFMALHLNKSRRSSFISMLPLDVLECNLIPWIVRRGCEAIAPRRRKLASLKSLLEISSQYLDDLQAMGDLSGSLDGSASETVSTLLTSTADEPTTHISAQVTTIDRIGVGYHTNHTRTSIGLAERTEWMSGFDELHKPESEGNSPLRTAVGGPSSITSQVLERFSIDSSCIYPLNNTLWEGADLR